MSELKYHNLSQLSNRDVPVSPRNPTMASILPYANQSFLHKHRQSHINFGYLKDYQLVDKIFPEQEVMKDAKMVNLLLPNSNIIDKEAIELLKKYPTNPIVFIGIYGKKNAGKSFWFDKTYNLAGIQGVWYGDQKEQKSSNSSKLRFLGTPFQKGNVKIFLLDFTGFDNQKLSREEQQRLDLMMVLSSVIIVLPDPQDTKAEVLSVAYEHFNQSRGRLLSNGVMIDKSDPHWPHSLYCLYRLVDPVDKELQKIGQLFVDYNFTIIQDAKGLKFEGQDFELMKQSFLDKDQIYEKYMKHVYIVFNDIYEKIKPKSYGNLHPYGKVMGCYLKNFGSEQRNSEKVQLPTVIRRTTKDLYSDHHQDVISLYDKSMSEKLKDERPESMEKLLNTFKGAREQAYNKFDDGAQYIDPLSECHEKTEKDLESDIEKRESAWGQIKRKKANQLLRQNLPRPQNISTNQDALNYLVKLKNSERDLDHDGRSIVVGQRLKEACEKQKNKFFVISDDASKIEEMQKQIEKKKRELEEIKKQKREKLEKKNEDEEKYQILLLKESKLDGQLENHKKLVELEDKEGQQGDKLRSEIYKKRKQELEGKLELSTNKRKEYEEWLKGKGNLEKQGVIIELLQQLKKNKREQEMAQKNMNNIKMNSKLHQLARDVEVRDLDKEKRIRKTRK